MPCESLKISTKFLASYHQALARAWFDLRVAYARTAQEVQLDFPCLRVEPECESTELRLRAVRIGPRASVAAISEILYFRIGETG